MGIKLPIIHSYKRFDKFGRVYLVNVEIEQSGDLKKFIPDGIKCVFRLMRVSEVNSHCYELVVLIDNHAPYGFHQHDKLPGVQDSRTSIQATNWKEAWLYFDRLLEEIMDET